jgi:hypothetical protein
MAAPTFAALHRHAPTDRSQGRGRARRRDEVRLMATASPQHPRLTTRLPLLAWVVALAAVVIGALAAVAELDDGWAVALAVVAAVAATPTVAIVARDELAETDEPPAARVFGVSRPAAVLGTTAVAALAVAAYGTSTEARAVATSRATAATAVRTVRDFLVAAAVDHNGEAACGVLTRAEQQRVGAPADGECRQVLDDGSLRDPDGAATEAAVRALPAAVAVRGRRATVRLGTGGGAAAFVLEPATFAEQSQFNAPSSAWRIAAGVTAPAAGSRGT